MRPLNVLHKSFPFLHDPTHTVPVPVRPERDFYLNRQTRAVFGSKIKNPTASWMALRIGRRPVHQKKPTAVVKVSLQKCYECLGLFPRQHTRGSEIIISMEQGDQNVNVASHLRQQAATATYCNMCLPKILGSFG